MSMITVDRKRKLFHPLLSRGGAVPRRRRPSRTSASLLGKTVARKHLGRKFPRSLLLVFALFFILFSLGASYLISGGRPIFGPEVTTVQKDDMFYRFFMEDKARESLVGPKGGPDTSTLKLFTYVIGKDDSLSKIAAKTGVSLDSLISLNRIQDAHTLRVGAPLTIPNQKGIYYRVGQKDTLAGISKRYNIPVETLKQVNAIDVKDLRPGRILFLPGAKLSRWQMEKVLGLIFRRPAIGGWLSSGFGYRRNPFTFRHQFHPGIDIALPFWTKIRAIRSGRVIFAGWKGGYGKLVVMRHTRGYSSRYGHMIKYIVRPGQWVRAGQCIGYVGSTGHSTGPHLHFELRRYGRLLNPFRVKGFRRAYRRGY